MPRIYLPSISPHLPTPPHISPISPQEDHRQLLAVQQSQLNALQAALFTVTWKLGEEWLRTQGFF